MGSMTYKPLTTVNTSPPAPPLGSPWDTPTADPNALSFTECLAIGAISVALSTEWTPLDWDTGERVIAFIDTHDQLTHSIEPLHEHDTTPGSVGWGFRPHGKNGPGAFAYTAQTRPGVILNVFRHYRPNPKDDPKCVSFHGKDPPTYM